MLNDRRRRILTALVEEYIRSAHPVGSRVLVDHYDLACSPATVRNDLSALEEAGYLYQPHVSAGRVPTDVGYREFVDSIAEQQSVHDELFSQIRMELTRVESELSELMRRTASVLTRLSNYVSVVLAPTLRRARVRKIDVVQLSGHTALVVLITDTGRVAKRAVDFREAVEADALAQIERALNQLLEGRQAQDIEGVADDQLGLPRQLVHLALLVVEQLMSCLAEADEDGLVRGETAAVLAEPEFEAPEMVRSLVGVLDDGLALAHAFSDAASAREVLVRIGAENSLAQLGNLSVVVAPYGPDASRGMVGLLGPTRMDYVRAIHAVRCVADSLTQALGSVRH